MSAKKAKKKKKVVDTSDFFKDLLPVSEYIYNRYLKEAKAPFSQETAKADEMIHAAAQFEGRRDELIQYLRSLKPFERHIHDAAKNLKKVDGELKEAVKNNNADEMTKGYFKLAYLLMQLKLWVPSEMEIKDMPESIKFTPEEIQFLDRMMGIDMPVLSDQVKRPEPIEVTRLADVDKRQLHEGGRIVDPDYEEPLRKVIRDHVYKNYGVERIHNFTGTKVPMKPNQSFHNVKIKEEVHDMTYFFGLSQFIENKYDSLRRSTYRPLDIERKESGGYKGTRIKFKEENGKLVEAPNGMISVEMMALTPHDISLKMTNDISLIKDTLTQGAKKIDNDYFFNVFYHIQKPLLSAEEMKEMEEQPETFERFEPSETDDYMKHRDRLDAETAMNLIKELSTCDQYVFGGHLDMDLYLDGIGIRKKPNVMMIEGEGLASFDYINNVIIIPTLCPPKITPIDQILAALSDFRYALWIDSPKDIWEQQGVGFQIIGKRSKSRASKALWSCFPARCSALIKQRAFRDFYRRHVLGFLFSNQVRVVAGCEVPTTNRIADKALRMYFDAYVPLKEIKDSGTVKKKEEKKPADKKAAAAAPAQKPAQAAQPAAPAAQKAAPAQPAAASQPAQKAPAARKQEPAQPAAQPASAPPAKPAPAQPAPTAAKCAKCGKDLPAGSKFCLECGTPVATTKKCKNCGFELPIAAKFCNECGTPQ